MKFPGRIWRVLRLDPSVYREVARDGAATRQAVLIYVLPALVAGVAGFFNPEQVAPFTEFGFVVLWAPAGLVILPTTLQWSGRQVLGQRARYGELFRTLGFASIPTMVATAIVINPEYVDFGGGLAILGFGFLWSVAGFVLATKAVYYCSIWEAVRAMLATQGFYLAMWLRFYRRFRIHMGADSQQSGPDEAFRQKREARRSRYRQRKGRDRYRR